MRAVNLIPVEQRSGASVGLGRSQGGAYAVIVLVGVLAGLGLLYGKASHEVATRTAQIATITAQTQQAQTDAGDLSSFEALNATRERRLAAVESLVESRFDWAHALRELGRVLPAHTAISSLSGAVGGGAAPAAAPATAAKPSTAAGPAAASSVTSATPPGSVPTFQLTGCSRTQSEVAAALEQLRGADGVQEVSLQSSTAGASTGAAAAAGGCSGGSTFSVTVTFAPLPAASAYAVKPASQTVAAAPETTGKVK